MSFLLFPKLNTIHADNGGNAILAPGWIHPTRCLPSSVLILGQKGHVEILVEDDTLDISPGKVALLPAGRIHQGKRVITEPASYFWMHFSFTSAPVLVTDSEGEAILGSGEATKSMIEDAALLPLNFALEDPKPFDNFFHDLLYEQECPSFSRQKFQLIFQYLLIRLTESVIADQPRNRLTSASSSIVYEILKIVSLRLTDLNLSVKTIAADLALNPDYMGRKFKSFMGLSVGDFILKKRIQFAICQLQETRDTVEKVAMHCGFGSTRQFMRQFRQQTGMTPSESRIHNQVMHINST